jgi:hypothetical protein
MIGLQERLYSSPYGVAPIPVFGERAWNSAWVARAKFALVFVGCHTEMGKEVQ